MRIKRILGREILDSRGERTTKYNQLLRIEEDLGVRARYLGKKAVATTR